MTNRNSQERLTQEALSELYQKLWEEALFHIRDSGFGYDSLIDSKSDNRFGITLLIRPSREVNDSIQFFINKIREIEPGHYFYPNSDIHVTVMPIISCYDGFRLDQVTLREYIDLLGECMKGIPRFSIGFRGVTASPSCLMIKGFPADDSLTEVRNRLRQAFKTSPLEQSLDKRYPLKTAHSTVVRFKDQVKRPAEILARVEAFQDFDFGQFEVGEMELVFNDWYQRKEWVQRLATFKLGGN